jgi:hypothetical protein
MVGAGLAIGFPGLDFGDHPAKSQIAGRNTLSYNFRYPRGGCTETGHVIFDRGPFGKEPFGYLG